MDSPFLHIKHLEKSYGKQNALSDISFSVNKGECFGLLGPNGAGKTTTISIISSLVRPDKGDVYLQGISVSKQPELFKRKIGVVPQDLAIYNDLSALDNLHFWGGLYGMAPKALDQTCRQLLAKVGLADRANDKVRTYSGGMKRRVNLAAALVHQPELLIMDEPTVGIDPQSRNLIFEVIEQLHQEGVTLIYTTHYMEEAERLCDRIGIMDQGKLIGQGTLQELRRIGETHEGIVVSSTGKINHNDFLKQLKWPGVEMHNQECFFPSTQIQNDLPEVIMACHNAGLQIDKVETRQANLESVFLQLTGKQLRD